MKLKYEQTVEDKIAFQLFLIEHSPYLRRSYIRVRCLSSFFTFLGLLVVINDKNMAVRMTFATCGGLLAYPLSIFITKLRITRAMRKLSDESKENDPSARIHDLEIIEEGLAFRSNIGSGTMNWTAITGIERTLELVCLMMSSTSGIAISPNHIIEGDLEAFIAESQRKISAARSEQATA